MKSFIINTSTTVSHVRLNVYNVARSLHFYHDLLGFRIIGNPSEDNAILSATGQDTKGYLLQLHKVNNQDRIIEGKRSIRQAGLFHFAVLLPSRQHLANIFKHLTENSNQLSFEGAADHSVSESLYLRDPDSNGIEIYRDRDQSEWKRTDKFHVEMKTDHLNLEQLLSEAEDHYEWHMPSKTLMGHVHLRVRNLVSSKEFYSKILGLHHTCSYPGANFFAAGSYHHHIATNTWLGNDIVKADSRNLGLDHFSLNLQSKENFEELLNQLRLMKVKVLSDDSNKINKKSFFIFDTDNIKIQIHY